MPRQKAKTTKRSSAVKKTRRPASKKVTTSRTKASAKPRRTVKSKGSARTPVAKTRNKCLPISIVIAALILSVALVFAAVQLSGGFGKDSLRTQIYEVIEDYVEEQERLLSEQVYQGPFFVEGDLALDRPSVGSADAPVVIVGFSDYECPFSLSFWTETFPSLKENYIDEGVVRFVHRLLPLETSDGTYPAALLAACVRDQAGDEAFFTVHHHIFNEIHAGLDFEDLVNFAVTNTGVNEETLLECFESEKFRDYIIADMEAGLEAEFTGTPSFVINGLVLPGAEPLPVFEAFIEEALAEIRLGEGS